MIIAWLGALVGWAGGADVGAEAEAVGPDRAEYNRLTQELELMAGKRAWSGAERVFQSLVDTGAAPSFEDWMRGAHAARALGDLTSVHARLLAAKAVGCAPRKPKSHSR